MTNWIQRNKKAIIRSAFLVPIFFVVAISISHVVSWYDLANPISWAVYLSIAIEIAALAAIAAASVRVKGFSIWFVFSIVTLVQFIGNIFFCYTDIDVASKFFNDWIELTQPITEAMGIEVTDLVAQKRFLALLEGGLLPLISLTCLHFFIKYGDGDSTQETIKPAEPIEDQDDLDLDVEKYLKDEDSTEPEEIVSHNEDVEEWFAKSADTQEEPTSEKTEEKKPIVKPIKTPPLSHKMTQIIKNNQKKNDSKS